MSEDIKMFGFATGEVSSAVKFRTDIDKYSGACRRLKNFDVDVTGAVVRRKGAELCSSFYTQSDSTLVTNQRLFYSGRFLGEEVIILFQGQTTAYPGFFVYYSVLRDGIVSPFVQIGVLHVPNGCSSQDFRFRQYNDTLFVCGNNIVPHQIKFVSFDGAYVDSFVLYEAREEDPSASKNKRANLIDSENGIYQWTYSVADSGVYKTITATGTFPNAKDPNIDCDYFPFTIPPTIGFRSLDGAVIKNEDDNVFTLPEDEDAYDPMIPKSMVDAAQYIALEDKSTESVYMDWGVFGADGAKTAGAVSDVYFASGNTELYFFSSGGRWCGQLALQVCYDGPDVSADKLTWIDVGYITAAADGALSPAVTFKINHYNARVRVKLASRSAASHYYYEEKEDATDSEKHSYEADMGCKWTLRISGSRRYYFTHSNGYGHRINAAPQTVACSSYSVGAFNASFGFPITMDIAQQRMWFFSSESFPKYFWASKLDDIANFSTGTQKTDGMCFEADSGTPDLGRWLKFGKGQFQFGCSQSEGNLVGKDNDYSLNPTSLALENESAWGSANADAVQLGEKIFYIKAGGKLIFAQNFDSGRARYVSGEANVLARHLFSHGKRAIKLIGLRAPDTTLFVLREDGVLARFVFNEEQNVGAWSTYDFGASGVKIEDIGVIYGEEADSLIVMGGIKSTVNKGDTLLFGRINPERDTFVDFGQYPYESELITHALSISEGTSYGGRSVISKVDLYGTADEDCDFEVSFDGGQTYKEQYAGISGKGLFTDEADARRISWSGSYHKESCIGVRTSSKSNFSLLAIGASIIRSDVPATSQNRQR